MRLTSASDVVPALRLWLASIEALVRWLFFPSILTLTQVLPHLSNAGGSAGAGRRFGANSVCRPRLGNRQEPLAAGSHRVIDQPRHKVGAGADYETPFCPLLIVVHGRLDCLTSRCPGDNLLLVESDCVLLLPTKPSVCSICVLVVTLLLSHGGSLGVIVHGFSLALLHGRRRCLFVCSSPRSGQPRRSWPSRCSASRPTRATLAPPPTSTSSAPSTASYRCVWTRHPSNFGT